MNWKYFFFLPTLFTELHQNDIKIWSIYIKTYHFSHAIQQRNFYQILHMYLPYLMFIILKEKKKIVLISCH